MPKFRFSLDAMLEMRRRAERDQQIIVARVESERKRIEDRIRDCADGVRNAQTDLRSRLQPPVGNGVNPREAAWQTHAVQHLRSEADSLVIKLAGVMKRLEREHQTLVELAKQRRSLEKLRERRHTEWISDIQHKERIELDDLACIRAGRKELGGRA